MVGGHAGNISVLSIRPIQTVTEVFQEVVMSGTYERIRKKILFAREGLKVFRILTGLICIYFLIQIGIYRACDISSGLFICIFVR